MYKIVGVPAEISSQSQTELMLWSASGGALSLSLSLWEIVMKLQCLRYILNNIFKQTFKIIKDVIA